MLFPADKRMIELTKEVIAAAALGYTEDQRAEIPAILACKSRYWWCIDMQLWDTLGDTLTEPFTLYSNGVKVKPTGIAEQVRRSSASCDDTVVPLHMGHQYLIQFTGERSCRLLTRMSDYHTYKDDESTYEGWGMYLDDLVKCDDDVWRIQTQRLTYRKIEGKLRNTGMKK